MDPDELSDKYFLVMRELTRILPRLTRIKMCDFELAIWKIFPQSKRDPLLLIFIIRQIVYIYDLKHRYDPPSKPARFNYPIEARGLMEDVQVPDNVRASLWIGWRTVPKSFPYVFCGKVISHSKPYREQLGKVQPLRNVRVRQMQEFLISEMLIMGSVRDRDCAPMFLDSFRNATCEMDYAEFDELDSIPIFINHFFEKYFEKDELIARLPDFDIGERIFAEAREFKFLTIQTNCVENYCEIAVYMYAERNLINPIPPSGPKEPPTPTTAYLIELYGKDYLKKLEEAFDDTDSEDERVDLDTILVPWYNPRFTETPEIWEKLIKRETGLMADERGRLLPGQNLDEEMARPPPEPKWYDFLLDYIPDI